MEKAREFQKSIYICFINYAKAIVWKGVRQGSILSPCLFNLYADYIMRNAGLEETQAGIKFAGRNINNLRYTGRRKWQPTPVFLPRESRGQRSLVGCRLLGRTELDTTEPT